MVNEADGKETNHLIRKIFRFLALLLLVSITLSIGYYLGNWLKNRRFQGPSVALGLAFVLGTMKDAIPQIQKAWEYVANGLTEHLYPLSAFVFLAAVSIVAASVLPEGTATQQSGLAPIIFLQENPASSGGPSAEGTSGVTNDLRISIPFFHEATTCKGESDFGEGVVLDKSTQTFMEQLANGICHCAEERRPVTIKVYGFASSKPFDRNECGTNSDELNRRVANLRAKVVTDSLNQIIGGLKNKYRDLQKRDVVITPVFWDNAKEMFRQSGLNDRDATGKPDVDRGDLTRRADLVIADPGGCRIVTGTKK